MLLSFNGIGHRPSKLRIWVRVPAGVPDSRGPRDGHPTMNRVYAGSSPAGSSMALWLKGVGARFLIEIQTSVKTRYFGNVPRKLNAPTNCACERDEIQPSSDRPSGSS